MRTRAERRISFFKNRGSNTSIALKRRGPKARRLKRGTGFEEVLFKFRRDTGGDETILEKKIQKQKKEVKKEVFEVSVYTLLQN